MQTASAQTRRSGSPDEALEHIPNAAKAYAALAGHPTTVIATWILLGVAYIVVARIAYVSRWGWQSALIELSVLAVISLFLLGVFLVVRVYVVARHSKAVKAETQTFVPAAVSYLYVLGSGGHTTEMIDLIKLTWKPNEFAHRRYIITPDDTTSKLRKRELERLIGMADNGLSAGTHDTFLVNRTRDVHETFLSSIRSTLRCFGQVIDALTQTPAKRVLDSPTDAYKHPHVIVTNGPGTGFIVALVAFTLKVLYLAPADRMQVLYFESWARTHNLGVTGKLFHWLSPLVSLFAVQNDTLAKKFGKPNIGNINAMLAKLPRPATASGTAEAPGLSPFEAASHDEVSDEAVALSNVSRGYNSRADISPNQAPHDNLSHIYVFHRSY